MFEQLGVTVEPFSAGTVELAASLRPLTRDLGMSLDEYACLALGLEKGLTVCTADRAWRTADLEVVVQPIRSLSDYTSAPADDVYPVGSPTRNADATDDVPSHGRARRSMSSSTFRGYLVHLYTTSTLLFVVLGMVWILEGNYQLALLAMAIGLVIDATDGTLARKHRVAQTAPAIDGSLLDNIVDFASYVVLPILFLLHAGLLLQPVWAFATLLAFSSAYGFSRTTAKQSDEGFFVGFPSYWNVVVFYAYLLDLSPELTTALVVGLSLFVFTGVRFLYVSRLRRGRSLHFVLGSAWGAALIAALFIEPGPLRTILAYGSLSYVAVYTLHSFVLDRQSRREERATAPRTAELSD